MGLSSLQLEAFFEVARQGGFSSAAKKLFITQSALSQRILNLESELGSTLFLREPSGVRLTELGQRLLRYCQAKEALEGEFLAALKPSQGLSGIVRVAGFSTITKSVLIPIVAGVLKENPALQVEILTKEIRDLPALLASGAVDIYFSTEAVDRQEIECRRVGWEENILVRPANKAFPADTYLDHDMQDRTTLDFLKHQGRKTTAIKRHYLGDIHGIIEGVRRGMGQAVLPAHLLEGQKGLEIVTGMKALKLPVYMIYYAQSYLTKTQEVLFSRLKEEIPGYLL